MHWSDIIDKSGKCEIRADMSILEDFYDAKQIQELIDAQGVRAFYELVNPKLRDRSKGRALMYISGSPDLLIDHHFTTELV